MAEKEQMVPASQAVRMWTTGQQWQSGLFIEAYSQLKDLLGREKAKEILKKALYDTGVKMGKALAEEVGRTDARGMAEAWALIYGITPGGEGTEKLTDDLFIFTGTGCAGYKYLKDWGVSDEEMDFLSDAFCAGDDGFAVGFNPEMEFDPTHRLTRGDSGCRWVHSTED